MLGVIVAGGLAVAGCGSTTHFVGHNRPPTPVDLTVYINDARVSVSPASVGAGPVIFYVTNQASRTESLMIQPRSGSSQSLASTGPINPRSTAQVTVDFTPGDYTVGTSAQTDALPGSRSIASATLRIGKLRANANNTLLQP
jgi:hypothetical protein